MPKSPFLQSLESFMRTRNYSKRTIDSYLYWIKYFIVFSGKKHPKDLSSKDIEAFLTYLAVNRQVAPGTQSLALNALVFLKTKYLSQPLEPLQHFIRPNRQRKLPVVLTVRERCEVPTSALCKSNWAMPTSRPLSSIPMF